MSTLPSFQLHQNRANVAVNQAPTVRIHVRSRKCTSHHKWTVVSPVLHAKTHVHQPLMPTTMATSRWLLYKNRHPMAWTATAVRLVPHVLTPASPQCLQWPHQWHPLWRHLWPLEDLVASQPMTQHVKTRASRQPHQNDRHTHPTPVSSISSGQNPLELFLSVFSLFSSLLSLSLSPSKADTLGTSSDCPS